MLLSAVSVLVVAQSISGIPEELMNNPVYGLSGRTVYEVLIMTTVTCLEVIGLYRILVEKPEEKRPFGKPKLRWEGVIKMDLD